MVKNFFSAFCVFAFLLFLSQTVQGCFCPYKNLKDTFSTSNAVFIGKVSKISFARKASVVGTFQARGDVKWEKYIDKVETVTLEIVEPLKGATEKTFVIFTPVYNGGGNCGIQFKEGESYLVFAGKPRPMLNQDEAARPLETRTPEARLHAEVDKFNESLPQYTTEDCLRTEKLRFMKEELNEIRGFLKKSVWKEPETSSPFMPPLP